MMSQEGIRDTTKMTFPTKTVRLIAKDLNKKDFLEKENKKLYNQIGLYKSKIIYKDSINRIQKQQRVNDSIKFIESENKFKTLQDINIGLKKDIKKEKNKTIFYKITTGIVTIFSIFIIIK